jgi:hypothetical protein
MGLSGGLFSLNLDADNPISHCILPNKPIGSTTGPVLPHSLVADGDDIVFTDTALRQVWRHKSDGKLALVCGSGLNRIANGAAGDAAFAEPTGICVEGRSLHVADAGGSIRLIVTDTKPLCKLLEHLHTTLVTFGVHLTGQPSRAGTISDGIACLTSFYADLVRWNRAVNDQRESRPDANIQGPDGGVPSKIVESIYMLLCALRDLENLFHRIAPNIISKFRLQSCLTNAIESFFSIMRADNPTPTLLEYCNRRMLAVLEIIRKLTKSPFHVFTSLTSHYTRPDQLSVRFSDIKLTPKQTTTRLSHSERRILQDFANQGKSVRQLTVRQQSTKYKSGTLPLLAYNTTASAGPSHNFSVARVQQQQVHALNENFTAGSWLAVYAAYLPEFQGPDMAAFAIGRCETDCNNAHPQISVALFRSLPQQPLLFSLVASCVLPKAAIFDVLSADSVAVCEDDDEFVELTADQRDELLNALSPEDNSTHATDKRSLAEHVDAAASNSAPHVSRRKRSNHRKPRKKVVKTRIQQSKGSETQTNANAAAESMHVDVDLKVESQFACAN